MRVISRTAIPLVRARTLTFTGTRFKPKTRLYAFFNKQAVSAYCTPSDSTFTTTDSNLVVGAPLVSDGTGKIVGTFAIPDPKVQGNPTFSTGDIEFRLTSSEYNGTVSTEQRPGTAGTTTYSSSGLLETQQETIIAIPKLKNIPHPAEWIVNGHRPQGASIPSVPNIEAPIDSVKVTATNPAINPRVTPSFVKKGHQHIAIREGHIWNPYATANPPNRTKGSDDVVATSSAARTITPTPILPRIFCIL